MNPSSRRPHRSWVLVAALCFALPHGTAHADAIADIDNIARCQRRFAREGARFAQRVIRATLKCTLALSECQVQCDAGVFGPSCDSSPPPCCDSDDTSSNATFSACMTNAQAECTTQEQNIARYEESKVNGIKSVCFLLSDESLCGAQADGLGFATLNAGCQALDPTYTCTLDNLINCVGGPLERAHLDQISQLLHPRASSAVAVGGVQSIFPDLPIARRGKEDLPEGKMDVWAITGQAGDEIVLRVKTRDDTGTGTSNLHPAMFILDTDQMTVLPDTLIKQNACSVPNVCGSTCPHIKRRLPFSGTYYVAVKAVANDSCGAGAYTLVVVSPNGTAPTLVADDVDGNAVP